MAFFCGIPRQIDTYYGILEKVSWIFIQIGERGDEKNIEVDVEGRRVKGFYCVIELRGATSRRNIVPRSRYMW